MRHLVVMLTAMVLMACSRPPETNDVTPTRDSGSDSQTATNAGFSGELPVDFLLAAAAADFKTHGPMASDVRNVRLGREQTQSGEAQYVLCGEFLPAEEGDEAEWWPFATLKTSDYEQWLGAQAMGICRQSSVIWDEIGDLTSQLRERLDNTK